MAVWFLIFLKNPINNDFRKNSQQGALPKLRFVSVSAYYARDALKVHFPMVGTSQALALLASSQAHGPASDARQGDVAKTPMLCSKGPRFWLIYLRQAISSSQLVTRPPCAVRDMVFIVRENPTPSISSDFGEAWKGRKLPGKISEIGLHCVPFVEI